MVENLCVGLSIKRYLEENGILQSYLSEKVHIANNTLSNMLNGKRKISVEEYFKICDALNKDYNYFGKVA